MFLVNLGRHVFEKKGIRRWEMERRGRVSVWVCVWGFGGLVKSKKEGLRKHWLSWIQLTSLFLFQMMFLNSASFPITFSLLMYPINFNNCNFHFLFIQFFPSFYFWKHPPLQYPFQQDNLIFISQFISKCLTF